MVSVRRRGLELVVVMGLVLLSWIKLMVEGILLVLGFKLVLFHFIYSLGRCSHLVLHELYLVFSYLYILVEKIAWSEFFMAVFLIVLELVTIV